MQRLHIGYEFEICEFRSQISQNSLILYAAPKKDAVSFSILRVVFFDQTIFVCKMIPACPCSDSSSWIRLVIPFFPVTRRLFFRYESGMPEAINHTHFIPPYGFYIANLRPRDRRKCTGKPGTLFSSYSQEQSVRVTSRGALVDPSIETSPLVDFHVIQTFLTDCLQNQQNL